MFSRKQLYILSAWVGVPFALMIALALINPNYERWLFIKVDSIYGIYLLLIAQVLNFLTLALGFLAINKSIYDAGKHPGWGNIAEVTITVLAFIIFVLPALWIVLLWPSIAILHSRTG